MEKWIERTFGVGLVVLFGLLVLFEGNRWDEPSWVLGGLVPILLLIGIVIAAIGAWKNRSR